MSTLAIDINDVNLIVADASGVLASEPGYAVVGREGVLTGGEAYAQARLRPRESSNRFWHRLSLDEGSAGIDGASNTAQLAFAQLEDIWKRFGGEGRDVVLVVPDHYTRDQLGLLLGLAQECSMPVRALVNAAVAASACPYPGHQLVYLDVGLHRVSATALEQGDDVAARSEQSIEGVGFASLMDLWAKRVAELFVLATRFDPFHSAQSEQRVYDNLPGWIQALQENDQAELTLPHGDKEVSIEVKRDQLLGAASGFYRAVVQLLAQTRGSGQSLVIQVSHRLLRLPGVMSELARLDDTHVVALDEGQAPMGAIDSLASMAAGEQVKLLKRLPWRRTAVELESTAVKNEPEGAPRITPRRERVATHIVYRGVAIPVSAEGLLIGREDQDGRRTLVLNGGHSGVSRSHCELVRRDGELRLRDLSQFGTFVNEKRVSEDLAIQPADIIRIGSPGEELQAIVLEASDGA
ncbi:MAG TPA: FHA domain-containing protein [Gammaproteobacteria bacterium]